MLGSSNEDNGLDPAYVSVKNLYGAMHRTPRIKFPLFCKNIINTFFGSCKSRLGVRGNFKDIFSKNGLRQGFSVPLTENILIAASFYLEVQKNSQQIGEDEKMRLGEEIAVLVGSLLEPAKAKRKKLPPLFFIVSVLGESNHLLLQFPELILDADSYCFLVSALKLSMETRLKSLILVKSPKEFLFPLAIEPHNVVTYLPLGVGVLMRQSIKVCKLELMSSTEKELKELTALAHTMKKSSSVLGAHLYKLLSSGDGYLELELEQLLVQLMVPIPACDYIEYQHWRCGNVFADSPGALEQPRYCLMVLLKQGLGETELDGGKRHKYIVKSIRGSSTFLVNHDSLNFTWEDYISKNTACYQFYYALANYVDVTKTKLNAELEWFPGREWLQMHADEHSQHLYYLIHQEPYELSDIHNLLLGRLKYFSDSAARKPHPLLWYLANDTSKYLNLIVYGIFGEFSKTKDSRKITFKQLCLFLRKALVDLLEIHEDEHVLELLTTLAKTNPTLASHVCQNFSYDSIFVQYFRDTYSSDDNNSFGIAPGEMRLPVEMLKQFYMSRIHSQDRSRCKLAVQGALLNLLENFFPRMKVGQSKPGVPLIFNETSRDWCPEPSDLASQMFETLKTGLIDVAVELQDAEKQEMIHKITMNLTNNPRDKNCKFSESDMDLCPFFILVRDLSNSNFVYDVLQGGFSSPSMDHRLSGFRKLNLGWHIDELMQLMLSHNVIRLFEVLFSAEFTDKLRDSLTKKTGNVDNPGYEVFMTLYVNYVKELLKDLQPDLYGALHLEVADETLPQPHLDGVLRIYIVLAQIFCIDGNYLNFIMRWLASLLVKGSSGRECYFLSGTGRNGKTCLMNMLGAVLDSYMRAGETDIFKKVPSFDDAASHVYFSGMLMFTDEVDGIKSNVFKAKLSKGEVEVRGIYAAKTKGRIVCTFVAATNNHPSTLLDGAALERIVSLPFDSTYALDKVPLSIAKQVAENTYAASDTTEKVMPPYLLLAMMMNLREHFCREKGVVLLPEKPELVRRATQKFRAYCSSFRTFLKNSNRQDSPGERLSLDEVKKKITDFCKTSKIPGQEAYLFNEFVKRYKEHLIGLEYLENLNSQELYHFIQSDFAAWHNVNLKETVFTLSDASDPDMKIQRKLRSTSCSLSSQRDDFEKRISFSDMVFAPSGNKIAGNST
ncbi:hypothetical protein HDE_00874 [Halotydeus destructor]|nr:hypothetical protein HDE_00874 [Halotydeus destructor]